MKTEFEKICQAVLRASSWSFFFAPSAQGTIDINLSVDASEISANVIRHERSIHIDIADTSKTETLEHLILDLVLPKLLAYDGHLVLHGGVVGTPVGAIGFIAPSGHGKSTLTASLHHRGLPLMSDDAILVRPGATGYRAERLYPSLRLFPDSLDWLFPGADNTSVVADYTEKRRVPFAEGPESAPLVALFRLADPSDDIRITRLPPADACMAIIANAFSLDPSDSQETRRRFSQAAEAARHIPVYDLHHPRDYAALPDIHTRILSVIGLSLPEDNAEGSEAG